MTVKETLQSQGAAFSEKAHDAIDVARENVGKAVDTARETAGKAAETTSHAAQDFGHRAAAMIEASPLGVLVGGIAAGMLAGSLLPRTQSEARLLAPVGKRLTDTAHGAIDAAKETAQSEFASLGLSRDSAKDQVGKLLGGVVNALTAAGTAALTAKLSGGNAPASVSPAPAEQANAAPTRPAASAGTPTTAPKTGGDTE
ncbi:hypothetical protein [Sphingomonas sp. CARO-RG-8B-R24-01]|uniref:hypothetical protein n=1 Tax=Sphingomonas sp. CARO-RG-8B-R24-01 TaxID=2914831 RepID=UPI001F579E17|nr:hypothetical protein [Sphingomonas sp. CARO-RG-8B-R24-01]